MVFCAIDHLEKYSILSKVELSTVNDLTTCAQLPNSVETVAVEENFWRSWNVEIGLVWIYPQTRTKLIPQMINLQRWGEALSFTKGCYIGQEIIARTHYLGKLKRRLYRASVICHSLPEPGAKLRNQNSQNVGIIVEAASKKNKEHKLLAVLQDTAIENDILFDHSVLETISVV
nr:tRNA-modifying protein YgfZ [Coxiella endosymbiont of Amblyomma sculptum]